ncbi:MAG: hypothetical protein WCB53_06605 [Terriglobales bacterium]
MLQKDQSCTTIGRILPPNGMPSTRPKLILDEDSFQGLLAAAFTIQQYNAREGGIDGALSAELNATLGLTRASKSEGRARPAEVKSGEVKNSGVKTEEVKRLEFETGAVKTEEVRKVEAAPAKPSSELCLQCGALLPGDGVPCPACEAEILRPGERLQRNWATMWSMSQEQGLTAGQGLLPKMKMPEADAAGGGSSLGADAGELEADREGLRILPVDAAATLAPAAEPASVKVRFRRADLYLGLAVLVALCALLWPSASAGRDELRPWERMLIAVGIAEAPPNQAAEVQYSGDPNIKVWVDTQAALYYCPGDELYGKSAGYYTTQHAAQLDRFEPALRRACVP